MEPRFEYPRDTTPDARAPRVEQTPTVYFDTATKPPNKTAPRSPQTYATERRVQKERNTDISKVIIVNQCFPKAINSPVHHLQGCQDATNLTQEHIDDSNKSTRNSSMTQTWENTSTINNSSDTPNTKKYGKNWQQMNSADLPKE